LPLGIQLDLDPESNRRLVALVEQGRHRQPGNRVSGNLHGTAHGAAEAEIVRHGLKPDPDREVARHRIGDGRNLADGTDCLAVRIAE